MLHISDAKRELNNHVPAIAMVAAVRQRRLGCLQSRHIYGCLQDNTLIHNPNSDRFLWFPPEQHPIVCQLGGSSPTGLAAAAAVAGRYGYDEVNLNCGCPRLAPISKLDTAFGVFFFLLLPSTHICSIMMDTHMLRCVSY